MARSLIVVLTELLHSVHLVLFCSFQCSFLIHHPCTFEHSFHNHSRTGRPHEIETITPYCHKTWKPLFRRIQQGNATVDRLLWFFTGRMVRQEVPSVLGETANPGCGKVQVLEKTPFRGPRRFLPHIASSSFTPRAVFLYLNTAETNQEGISIRTISLSPSSTATWLRVLNLFHRASFSNHTVHFTLSSPSGSENNEFVPPTNAAVMGVKDT